MAIVNALNKIPKIPVRTSIKIITVFRIFVFRILYFSNYGIYRQIIHVSLMLADYEVRIFGYSQYK